MLQPFLFFVFIKFRTTTKKKLSSCPTEFNIAQNNCVPIGHLLTVKAIQVLLLPNYFPIANNVIIIILNPLYIISKGTVAVVNCRNVH